MNRYPLWKYLLILAVLLAGLIYTLPNFYGESPAVQVSPLRASLKADAALLERVTGILREAGLKPEVVALDGNSVKARFGGTDEQIKARDLLIAKLGEDYMAALNLLSRSPSWLARFASPMYLGLDLRGGVHFLLQVDMKAALDKALEAASSDIRSALREQNIAYSGVARDGNVMVVRFRDAEARGKGEAEIKQRFNDYDLSAKEEGSDFLLRATLKPEAERRIQESAVQQNLLTLRNRVNELGVAEPVIQQQGLDRVVVQLPGVQDTARAKDILGRTATLEVRMVDDEHQITPGAALPFGTELFKDREGNQLLVKKQVILTGERISDAQPGFDSRNNEPAVHINLDNVGARKFKDATRENVGKRMAIILFEKGRGEVVTAPVIREEIGGGRVQISGQMNTVEAQDTSLLLRAGALAAPMEIVEERTIGPSLGAENIQRGFDSTKIGFIMIAVFMGVYYLMFGAISVLALGANLLLLVAMLSMLQATLTLPGMAGIALTLGMAIDANVLINERIREELRNGVTPQAAIHAGYDRAFSTILDSNITTLIAGVTLFMFGSGPVKGFAVVLCLGILTSMFSAMLVSRALVNLIYGRKARLNKVAIG
ncbi:MAG TPA: protein translocase subunit SecD [Gallionella sp.]|nr:protein translocase subunit SecD [Gallionella sp.]